MAQEPSPVEQAVSRALRDNLDSLRRAADELSHAVADFVSACSSSRPANTLPPMLRAQTAAASLAAALEVLARFVTGSMGQPARSAAEEPAVRAVAVTVPEPPPMPSLPPPALPTPMAAPAPAPAVVTTEEARDMVSEGAPVVVEQPGVGVVQAPMGQVVAPPLEVPPPPKIAPPAPPAAEPGAFNIATLPLDEQEMHRRAKRVAKVSMQDIKMLKPEQVRLGRENKDLCKRLRDDFDKARKEYDRRFKPILSHPVDYFYEWAVEILADGDPTALGEYPYPSPLHRR